MAIRTSWFLSQAFSNRMTIDFGIVAAMVARMDLWPNVVLTEELSEADGYEELMSSFVKALSSLGRV
jgi:hypothetical protein